MEKSYEELKKIITLAGNVEFLDKIYRGSTRYLPDERTPVESEAARFMSELANDYSPEKPLYIVAIGAITNVASAILMNPAMKENTVIVWLGGHAQHHVDNNEFNLRQDVAAARIIFGCGVPFVQLPCCGVVDKFATSRPELEYWLKGKNALCDYLVENTIEEAESYAAGKPWTRVIWDVTAVAWLLNDDGSFMQSVLKHSPIPEYDNRYAYDDRRHFFTYVYSINRDRLFRELFDKLSK
jgi:inosine-uridine nucleoside N-ribohydrolase